MKRIKRKRPKSLQSKQITNQIPWHKSIGFIYEVDDACLWKICDELSREAFKLDLRFVKSDLIHAEELLHHVKVIVLNRIGTMIPRSPVINVILDACKNPMQRITYYMDDLLLHRFDGLAIELMKAVGGIVTTTEYLKAYFVEELDIDESKISVVPTHIDMDMVTEIDPIDYPDDKFHILWPSGGIAGLDLYCKILDKLSHYNSSKNISFTVLTASPSTCRMYAYKYPIKQHFLGFVNYPVLIGLEKGCDLMINPMSAEMANIFVKDIKNNEQFINAKAEVKYVHAGACMVPLITSPNPAYENCIKDGENGFIADTVDGWVNLILTLVDDDNERLRKMIATEAYMDVRDNYSSSAVIGKYLNAYTGSEADVEDDTDGGTKEASN